MLRVHFNASLLMFSLRRLSQRHEGEGCCQNPTQRGIFQQRSGDIDPPPIFSSSEYSQASRDLGTFCTGQLTLLKKKNHELYLFLELCEGGTLKDFLSANFPCGMNEANGKRFLVQVKEGLTFMRDHRITHRDLKPANILLSSSSIDDLRNITLKIAGNLGSF